MGIPNKINPMTGGDILPRGYIAAEFLETTNAKIQVPFSFSLSQDEVRVEMETSISLSTSAIQREGYIGGSNSLTIGQYNKQFSVTIGSGAGIESADLTVGAFYKVWCNFTGQGYSFGSGTTVWNSKVQNYNNNVPFYNLFNADRPWQTKRKWWKAYKNQELQFDLIPALDSQGQPIFYNKVDGTAYGNTGTGAFGVGMTVSQARYLCKLPIIESGTLTVSLPWEAQYDTGVQNALSIAATRGWTITVQYRDPEIATTNIPIGFLESTGTQYIILDTKLSSNASVDMESRFTQYVMDGAFFGSETTDYTLSASNRFTIITRGPSRWRFDYGTDMREVGATIPINKRLRILKAAALNYVDNILKATNLAQTFDGLNCVLFSRGLTGGRVKGCIYWCKIYNDVLLNELLPCVDRLGKPCMYDKVSKQPFYNSGTGSFIVGFDTVEQARNLAHLPDVTAETDETKKSLTVSLPWEAQLVTTYVPAALQVAANRGWTITVQYRELEADNAYYNKYAECVTYDDVLAINPNAKDDVTEEGAWVYKLPNLQSAVKSSNVAIWRSSTTLKTFAVNMPSLINAGWGFQFSTLEEFTGALPKLEIANACFMRTRLKKWTVDLPELTDSQNMYQETPMVSFEAQTPKISIGSQMFRSCSSLTTFVGALPLLLYGDYMFHATKLNKESALRVLYSIPTYSSGTHNLTLGIHIDHQNDEEVLTAIADAETKGWTLTVQWNGTATAAAASVSTFGLRSPSIYAKLGTMEHPDGTTENVLDWGHYVTNWEENGYQEFSSIEEANEYFNINQIEEV